MIYLLDSNICIYVINEHPKHVLDKFKKMRNENITISSIVLSELAFGVYNSHHVEKNLLALEKFSTPIKVLPYDENAAYYYGEIRAYLKKNGNPIGQLDAMIAAHALSINATLVTNNTKEFSRVKNLKCENWIL